MPQPGTMAAVLWDMDGVIVDSGDAHYLSWQEALNRHGLSCTRDFFDQTFGMNNTGFMTRLLGRRPTDREMKEIAWLKEEIFRRDAKKSSKLLPGVADWLGRFARAGIPQAVASSAPQANIDAVIQGLGLEKWFQALVSGSDMPGKPDPSVFLLAAERLGAEPARCLVIEDAKVGVEAAKSAGMQCLAVLTTHPEPDLAQADMVLKNLAALTDKDIRAIFPRPARA